MKKRLMANRKLCLLCLSISYLSIAAWVQAQTQLTDFADAICANADKGKEILGKRDDFIKRLSEFDRSGRMKVNAPVSEKEILAHVQSNVLPWSEQEEKKISEIVKVMRPALAGLHLDLPKIVYLIKTSGNEEEDAAYTRGNAIILPQSYVAMPSAALQKIVTHELFHVLSRNSPKTREMLYSIIQFHKCNEIKIPSDISARILTNPDAPIPDCYITLKHGGKSVACVPILLSRDEKYDLWKEENFLKYMVFQWLVVEKDNSKGEFKPPLKDGKATLLAENQVVGYSEAIGKNTQYILHPEEILASNFLLLVEGAKDAPSPEILDKMRTVLSDPRTELH